MHNQKFDTAKELVDRFGLDKLESSMSCLNRLVICAAHFGDEALYKKVMAKKPDDQYSEKEIKQRFEAALRGARIAGHKPMSEVSPKRPAKKKRASKHD